MSNNLLRSLARTFEDLPHGSVIMADETYLKSHPERIDNDDRHVFIPHYSLGAFSAHEIAEMILDADSGWYIITPKREENNHNG